MPININIVDFKCYNQLRNGFDFSQNLTEYTRNLVGNIGERVKIEYKASINYSSISSESDVWNVKATDGGTTGIITRSSGSFLVDGFSVDDVFEYFTNWAGLELGTEAYDFTGKITLISQDGKTIRYDVISGGGQSVNSDEIKGDGILINMEHFEDTGGLLTALISRFGILNNDETFNFLSKTTEAQQVYYGAEIIVETPPATSPIVNLTSLGENKDWVTGSATAQQPQGELIFKDAYFIITHELVLNPWYILDFEENFNNNSTPDFLAGDNSLKYAFELEFRNTLTDVVSKKTVLKEDVNGVTGWFGENFNGFNNFYQVDSVSYEDADTTDPLTGVTINGRTKVTALISRQDANPITDFSASIAVSKVPLTEDEYKNTSTTLIENFVYKNEVLAYPDVTRNDLTGSIVGGALQLEWIIEYTTEEKLLLSEEHEFMIWAQIEAPNISAGNSDRVALLLDKDNYTDFSFVDGFVTFDKYNFLQHNQVLGVDVGSATLSEANNEEGLLLDARFSVDTTKDVLINSLSMALSAYNTVTGDSFELDRYDFDLSSVIVDANGQQFTIDTTRNYNLPVGDQFNYVKFTTSNKIGNDQFFNLQFGQKIKWQDWIANISADPIFYDNTKPNDNLNYRSSNYSNINNYVIKIISYIGVSGIDDLGRNVSGIFEYQGGDITVEDYEVDAITGVIDTVDPESNSSLGGAVLYNGQNTLFRITYTRPAAESVTYAINRIEQSQSIGDGIEEMSNILPNINDLLIPLDGESTLKVTDNGLTVIVECLINGAKVQEGVNYKLSGMIDSGGGVPSTAIQWENGDYLQWENGDYIEFEN